MPRLPSRNVPEEYPLGDRHPTEDDVVGTDKAPLSGSLVPPVPPTETSKPYLIKIESRQREINDDPSPTLAHLTVDERIILKRQTDIPTIEVTFKMIFRYATRNDLIIMFISAICAIVGGAALPLMSVSVERILLQCFWTN
jgi:ATP-binding cassette subfamily B (MDR/TAP) protein 1